MYLKYDTTVIFLSLTEILGGSAVRFSGISSINQLLKNAAEYINVADFDMPLKLSQPVKSKLTQAISKHTTGTETNNQYFEKIPLQPIVDAIEEFGYTIIQEDGTAWDGFLVGADASVTIELGTNPDEKGFYQPITNAALILQWHKMPSGQYEINAYIS